MGEWEDRRIDVGMERKRGWIRVGCHRSREERSRKCEMRENGEWGLSVGRERGVSEL